MTLERPVGQGHPLLHSPDAVATPNLTEALLNQGLPLKTPVSIEGPLAEVRRMPEFQPPEPGWWEDWLRNPWVKSMVERLSDQIEALLQALQSWLNQGMLPGLAGLPQNIRDLFSGFIGFVLVLMSLYVFYLMLGWLLRLRDARSQARPVKVAPVFEGMRLHGSAFHYRQARAKAGKHQYDVALRQLYLAILCLLDENSVVPFDQARTNGDYRIRLAGSACVSDFDVVCRLFESWRYGGHGVDGEAFERSLAAYHHLEQAMQTLSPQMEAV